MRIDLRCLPILLAACGGGDAAGGDASTCPDAGPACGSACDATFTGNFTDSSTATANCATVMPGDGSQAGDTVLAFALPGRGLDAPLMITIDLGVAPVPGTYSSETTSDWSALASRTAAAGECIYSAGAAGVPTGSFTLSLTAIDPAGGTAHGELAVVQYVQAQATVDCGAGDNEAVDVRF